VLHDLRADRPQEKVTKPSEAPTPHHYQVGSFRQLDECLGRVAVVHGQLDLNHGTAARSLGHEFFESAPCVDLEVGWVVRRRGGITNRVDLPRMDGDDRVALARVVECPVQRSIRVIRRVDTNNDPFH